MSTERVELQILATDVRDVQGFSSKMETAQRLRDESARNGADTSFGRGLARRAGKFEREALSHVKMKTVLARGDRTSINHKDQVVGGITVSNTTVVAENDLSTRKGYSVDNRTATAMVHHGSGTGERHREIDHEAAMILAGRDAEEVTKVGGVSIFGVRLFHTEVRSTNVDDLEAAASNIKTGLHQQRREVGRNIKFPQGLADSEEVDRATTWHTARARRQAAIQDAETMRVVRDSITHEETRNGSTMRVAPMYPHQTSRAETARLAESAVITHTTKSPFGRVIEHTETVYGGKQEVANTAPAGIKSTTTDSRGLLGRAIGRALHGE